MVARASVLVAVLGLGTACAGIPLGPEMTPERLEALIAEQSEDVEASPGRIEFSYAGVRLTCVYDLEFDRVRIVAPVARESEVTNQQWRRVMAANFHTALDARYATSRGVLYAAFMHRLSALSDEELYSALEQVSALVRTFGHSYASSPLVFDPDRDEE